MRKLLVHKIIHFSEKYWVFLNLGKNPVLTMSNQVRKFGQQTIAFDAKLEAKVPNA